MKKSAFSLIELSIVILIIGILVAGVTQSSRLVAQMRLASARSITQSSPVSSITNLVLWLETTSEKSFDDAATSDGTNINSGSSYGWYDINPQNTRRYSATSATGPTYKASCINGLPCLSFNGSSQFLDLPQMNGPTPQMSIFVVYNNLTLTTTTQYLFSASGTGGGLSSVYLATMISSGLNYISYSFSTGSAYSGPFAVANNVAILESNDKGSSGSYLYYTSPNAAISNMVSGSATGNKDFTNGASIGSYYNGSARAGYFNGYIAEIIVFDRGLKTEERQAVESYLSKKWAIKI